MPSIRPFLSLLAAPVAIVIGLAACSADHVASPRTARSAPAIAAADDTADDTADDAGDDTNGAGATPGRRVRGLNRLKHVVVIYLENRSFDNLYGQFPGADGLASPLARSELQRDFTGTPYATLPQVAGTPIPTNLPNAPFDIERFIPPSAPTIDLVHRFYQEQAQIHGGLMDRYVAVSDAQGLTMGYYETAALPLYQEAKAYTLCDRFFHAAFGGSFLNHIWLIAAQTPHWPGGSPPPSYRVTTMDGAGHVRDGQVTSDGYLVNTVFSVNHPAPPRGSRPPVPNLDFPTIGDRLTEKGISWAWFSGGWNDALAGHPDETFQFHHQPFVYFANYADGTPAKAEHLKDETDFVAMARAGRLPAVSFIKPLGRNNEHPGYTDLATGEQHVKDLIDVIRSSKHWKHTAIVVTYDENGGFWDHVNPPNPDRWGSGTRIPTLVISPFARRGYVDHHTYDTTSILALIERRWRLRPLSARDAAADPLSGAFEFDADDTE